MGAPVLQFKRGQFSNLPGLRAGEPGFTTDKFDLYVGIDSTTSANKFFGSHRYWNRETATVGSSVRVVEGSNNGSNYIELKSPNSLAQNVSYTLPATDVANGILVSDGSGNLSYTTTVTGSGSGLSAGTVPLTSLDIDGGTDIGADLADGDLLIVDDGAGGTNRKTAMSRVKTYVLGGGSGATFAGINVTGIATVAFTDATQLKVSGVSTFTGTVDVNGAIDADGGANIAGGLVANSAAISDLTDGRVVLAGTSGELEDSGNLTFNGSTLGVTGAATVSTTLGVSGETTLASAVISDLTNDRVLIAGTAGAVEDSGNLTFNGSTLGVTGAVTASGTITGGQFTGSGAGLSGGTTPLSTLDIDGGTDIGADLVDADLIVVDDGAGGTNRKAAMSRVKNYVLGGGSGATFAAINVTGIATNAFIDGTQLKVSGISTFTGQTNHSTINASSTVTASAFHTGAEGSAIRVTSNTISGPATITLDPAGVGDNTGKVVIAGDFQVDGTTTTVNSTTMTVDDKNLELGTGAANDAAANGGGITIVSGEGNKTFQFEATGDNLGSSENLNIASGKDYKVNNVSVLNATTLGSSVVASSLTSVGNLTTLDVTGATNLNATTQSTSNTTGALIVDGGVGIAKNVNIGEALDVDGQITSGAPLRNSTGSGLIPGVGVITATSDAGLVTAFKFRGNGLENFIVEDGVADVVLSGVAATTFTTSETTVATQGQTAITVSAGYTDGFMDVYLNGVRLITGTDYTETNASTITLATGATAGDEIETVAWKSLGDVVNIASLKTAADLTVSGVATATGGFVGDLTGDVTGDVTGNADTATALANARTIGGVSFNGTANINLPGVNQTGDQDTTGNAATATVGTTITVADESSDTTCFPLFATAATGNLGAKSGTNLTFNSSSGALSATSFVGSGSGLTAGTTPITTLDIDGGTDIGADLADADLFIVDDGAGGTNRKVTFQRLSENILGGSGGATFAAINVTGIGTFGGVLDSNGGANISGGDGLVASSAKVSDLTDGRVVLAGTSGELEDSGNLTFNGSALTVTGTANVTSNLTVGGDLTVNGTTTQINTVNTTIEDTLLELQKVDGGNLGSDTNKDVGLVMNYYDGSAKKAAFFWDDSAGRFAFGSVVTENSGVLSGVTYGGIEIGALHVNDCAGASQVISCSGTTRSLENITIDGGSF